MRDHVFVIDIASCTGCYTCVIACKDRLRLEDDVNVLKVEEKEIGEYPNIKVNYRPYHCFHCQEPACVDSCPVNAIFKDEDGFVKIDREECVSCGNCLDACPFGAISFDSDEHPVKCDGCADELAEGWEPACVRSCPMRALSYLPLEEIDLKNRVVDPNFNDAGIDPAVIYTLRRA